MLSTQEQLEIIKNGTVNLIPEQELIKKLETKKPLIVKLGMDPTSPDLHLGHAVVLNKLRQFQELGHLVVFLIGDYTARIGDPTGKSKTRPALTAEKIKENATTYFDQVCKILDRTKTTIRYNSEWLSSLSFADVISLCGKTTLAQLIEREDFKKRLHENVSISLHELLYPICQGYDSVALKADIELGGTDQTFNLLMGRHLQEQFDQKPQVILTMPILEGLDGIQKMSKSYGNYIGLWEEAGQAYGKLMSISDELMWRYYHLLLGKPEKVIEQMKKDVAHQTVHPMNLKKAMAAGIVSRFWSQKEAEVAQTQFEALFQKQDYSHAQVAQIATTKGQSLWIVNLIKQLDSKLSSSEARRLIESGAVHIDNSKITDVKYEVFVNQGMIIRIGKHRIFKLS